MRFAKVVFRVAGLWGIVVLIPLYFLVDLTGRQYPAPTDYPQFFYGFLSVAMAWQIAFLVIGSSPARFRPLTIPSIVEKLGSRWPGGPHSLRAFDHHRSVAISSPVSKGHDRNLQRPTADCEAGPHFLP